MFHYSLRTLLLFILGVSVLCAVVFAVPLFLTAVLFLAAFLLSAPAFIAGAFYFRGRAQAFSLGCAVPTVLAMLGVVLGDAGEVAEQLVVRPIFGWRDGDQLEIKVCYFIYGAVIGLSGLTALGIYRVAKGTDGDRPSRPDVH